MQEKHSHKTYPITLKVDCQQMSEQKRIELASKIACSVTNAEYIKIQSIGEDTIYLTGEVTYFTYNKIWNILDGYNVILD